MGLFGTGLCIGVVFWIILEIQNLLSNNHISFEHLKLDCEANSRFASQIRYLSIVLYFYIATRGLSNKIQSLPNKLNIYLQTHLNKFEMLIKVKICVELQISNLVSACQTSNIPVKDS